MLNAASDRVSVPLEFTFDSGIDNVIFSRTFGKGRKYEYNSLTGQLVL